MEGKMLQVNFRFGVKQSNPQKHSSIALFLIEETAIGPTSRASPNIFHVYIYSYNREERAWSIA
jgi:hypothetical protein